MPERILDEVNPSLELVREWGYDEDLFLMEQDEDLLLHGVFYMPVLLELAADPACPKQYYAAAIASYFSQLCVLGKDRVQADAISQLALDSSLLEAPYVAEWHADFGWIYDRLQHPRALTADEAERLAWGLVVGRYVQRDLQRTGRTLEGYDEFVAFTESFRVYLYINAHTGDWQHRLFTPLASMP